MTDKHRNRILHAASQLFFHQGYHKTDLQDVLDHSETDQLTFAQHFASKEDLSVAYLEKSDEEEFSAILAHVHQHETPLTRFVAVIDALRPWMIERNFRGCIFINAVSEFPDPESHQRQIGVQHYERLRTLIAQLTEELKDSDREQYGHLNVAQVTEEYLVVLTGTIAMGSLYHSEQSMAAALRIVRRLLKP